MASVINLSFDTVYESCIPIPPVTNNFVFIPNEVFDDENLTMEALGVYCLLCSLDGKASLKELRSFSKNDSTKTVLNALNLLIKRRYVVAKQTPDDSGRAR